MNAQMLEATANALLHVADTTNTMTDVDRLHLVAGALEHTESGLQVDDLPWTITTTEAMDDGHLQENMDHLPGDMMLTLTTLVDHHPQLVAMWNHILVAAILTLDLVAHLAMGILADTEEATMIADTRDLKDWS